MICEKQCPDKECNWYVASLPIDFETIKCFNNCPFCGKELSNKGKIRKMIRCCICRKVIVKYYLDLSDTVVLKIKKEEMFVCDDCSHNIAKQRISR